MLELSEYIDFLNDSGVRLTALGLQELALSRANALIAVDILKRANAAILGGDVYHRRNSNIELAFANWYTNAKQDEDRLSYLQRSWQAANKYIISYPEKTNLEPFFSIVVDGQKDYTGR